MALPSGKVLSVELTYDAEKEEWGGRVTFESSLMPLDIRDALFAIMSLKKILDGNARDMIRHAESNYARDEALDSDIASGKVKPS